LFVFQLDARTLQAIKKIPSRNNGCGIRSVSFKGNILTIGTGIGLVLFWDIRAAKFLESTMNSNRAVSLRASKGWVVRRIYFYFENYFRMEHFEVQLLIKASLKSKSQLLNRVIVKTRSTYKNYGKLDYTVTNIT
jgi:hypothetical protein